MRDYTVASSVSELMPGVWMNEHPDAFSYRFAILLVVLLRLFDALWDWRRQDELETFPVVPLC